MIDELTVHSPNSPSRQETAMREKNRRKTARKRAAFKKKQKKRRARAAG